MRVTRQLATAMAAAFLGSPLAAQVDIPAPPAAPVPAAAGTGLDGQVWQCGTRLGSIANATACQTGPATLSFLATAVNSPDGSSGRTLAQFVATGLAGVAGLARRRRATA